MNECAYSWAIAFGTVALALRAKPIFVVLALRASINYRNGSNLMPKQPLVTVEDCDRKIASIDRSMEALQTLLHLNAGDVLTQAQLDDLLFLDEYHRKEEDTALNHFSDGYDCGLKRGAGADTAKLIEERDQARTREAVATVIRTSQARDAFRLGAQACREMMARFVEQGGDKTTAGSIRANWRPAWGDDPGAPNEAQYQNAKPCEIEARPASVDTRPEDGDAVAAPLASGAVPAEERADAQPDPTS